jgi:hypothetical protein
MHEGKLGNERFTGDSMVEYIEKVVRKISR